MQSMAQQVLVYRLTGSASALGIVSFMQVLPLIPFALWGGTLADRIPKRTLILVTQTLMMVQAILLAILTWTGAIEIWHVYLMSFLLGAAKAVDNPARHSFAVEMVEGKEDLSSAIGLNSAIHNAGRTLGPVLAGLAVATMGEAVAFALNALSFLAVIISLLGMRDLPQQPVEQQESHQVLTQLKEGVRFVFGQQTMLVLMSLVAVNSFLSRPYQTLMPVFADRMLKTSAQPVVAFLCEGENPLMHCQAPEALPLGLLLSATGLGAIMGALIVASLPERARRGRVLTLGNLGLPLLLLFFVNSRSLLLSMFLLVFVGMGQVLQNAMANTLVQITAPDRLRGRVMGLYSLVTQGMTHVGGLQAGFMTDWVGAPISVGAGAAIALLYGSFVAVRYRKVRDMA
jgi:MFS family permease